MKKEAPFVDLTEAQAPHLHKALEDLCKKAGIAKPQLCVPSKSVLANPIVGSMFNHLAGALHTDKPRIVLGEQARKILGHLTLDAEVSDPLKATLAHELSHLKHGDVRLYKIIPLRLSPFIGIAAGIAGLGLYNHLKKHEPQNLSDEDKKIATSQQLDSAIIQAKKDHPEVNSALSIIKYTAAAAFGFISMSVVSKMLHNRMELRADKFSAELMGSGKPLAEALGAFKTYVDKLRPEGAKVNPIARYIEWIMHPDIGQRINRLNGL